MTELKVCFLGIPAVGKTAIVNRVAKGKFDEIEPTIALETVKYELVKEDRKINITFWDTPGDIKFRSLFSSSYRNANVVLLVFSLTDKESFGAIDQAFYQVSEYALSSCRWILIGNKVDLQKERQVQTDSLRQKKEELNFFDFQEFSAKTGYGMNDLFDSLHRAAFKPFPEPRPEPRPEPISGIKLTEEDDVKKKREEKCCT
jgi:small GTP-binding protein